MTHYTKQIYDYEDDFDYRVPNKEILNLMELSDWLPKAIEAVENMTNAMKLFGYTVEYTNLLNSQSDFTQMTKDVKNASFDNNGNNTPTGKSAEDLIDFLGMDN